MNTLIIAEAGVNHNGDINLAKRLVDAAVQAGADIVKFQTFKADRLATTSAKKAEYQTETTDKAESQHDMLRRLELTNEMHAEIIDYCNRCQIKFLSTGFDIDSVNYLESLGQNIIKIPSGEITNKPYLRHIGSRGKKVIMSSGMASMAEIGAAIDVLLQAGMSLNDLTVLHCTTQYPTPMEEVNLSAMQSIKEKFNVAVGYSDHTNGIEVAVAAVAMGAEIIEKHFTLDKNLPGPDHKASLDPAELCAMVSAIRNIDRAIGDGNKIMTVSESKNRSVIRKSIVALKVIKKGQVFSEKNITVKRPANGICPMQWDDVIGKRAKKDFLLDEKIKL
jgi:N,N'-diacetyllegionaminate synthase